MQPTPEGARFVRCSRSCWLRPVGSAVVLGQFQSPNLPDLRSASTDDFCFQAFKPYYPHRSPGVPRGETVTPPNGASRPIKWNSPTLLDDCTNKRPTPQKMTANGRNTSDKGSSKGARAPSPGGLKMWPSSGWALKRLPVAPSAEITPPFHLAPRGGKGAG